MAEEYHRRLLFFTDPNIQNLIQSKIYLNYKLTFPKPSILPNPIKKLFSFIPFPTLILISPK